MNKLNGHLGRHFFGYTAFMIITALGIVTAEGRLGKRWYMDMDHDGIQDMVRITPLLKRNIYYQGQEDGSYIPLSSINDKENDAFEVELSREGKLKRTELREKQRARAEEFERSLKKAFEQYPR